MAFINSCPLVLFLSRNVLLLGLFPAFLLATEIPDNFPSVPAKWHQGLSSTAMGDYKPGEHLIVSEIWTGSLGKNATVKHMLAVRVDHWGKPFSDLYESKDKKDKETLIVTLYETDNPREMKAVFEHTVYEKGKVVLRFCGTTILERWH